MNHKQNHRQRRDNAGKMACNSQMQLQCALHLPSLLPSVASHLSFFLSLSLLSHSLSLPLFIINRGNRRQVLSRLPSQPPKYKPRDPASVGCLPGCLLSLHQGETPYQAERSPTVGEDDAQRDTDKYLSATQTLASPPQLWASRKPWTESIVVGGKN